MCGFAGVLTISPSKQLIDAGLLKSMGEKIVHRGPDDGGHWINTHHTVGFSFRRLSIIDLSPSGHQPMVSASGRFVMVFNGEIYNHGELRSELEESCAALQSWRGHSDTETLLACFEVWGVKATLKRAVGMFAIATWDEASCELILARDRTGEKPLYYGWQRRGGHAAFLFGSELKALKAHPAFEQSISRDALALYLRHSYVPTPYSIFEGIHKLEPGCLAVMPEGETAPRIEPYWSATDVAEQGVGPNKYPGTYPEAVTELDRLLRRTIRGQMVSDVPLGAFLSGGVDSSTVVALMQVQSDVPVQTFTIGFHEQGYDEAQHAKEVASHLGTDHFEMYISSQQAMDVIPRLPLLYDEPFSDASQIPTFLLTEVAKRKVTVALSGDGGDEVFCGYNRYQLAASLWRKLSCVPEGGRRLLAKGITSVSTEGWDRIGRLAPVGKRLRNFGDKMHKGADVLASVDLDALYLGLVSHWQGHSNLVLGARPAPTVLQGSQPHLAALSPIEKMMLLDTMSYLPDDILVKLDRASMGASLETRVPFLDHRIIEFAWRLPLHFKLEAGQTKRVLRDVLYRYVPEAVIDRPKMGFGVPLEEWLRGPLRAWAETLLDETRLKREGYLDPQPIRQKWSEHLTRERNWAYHLWDVLMFQSWLEAQ